MKITSGEAINMEEYVPTIIPKIMLKAKSLIIPPPNKYKQNTARKVVMDVIIVRDNVSFNETLTVSLKDSFFRRDKF